MRSDLNGVQYLSSKAGEGKLRFLDAVTNLTKLILTSSFVSISPLVSKIVPCLNDFFLILNWGIQLKIYRPH